MPGQTTCFRCGSVLDGTSVTVDVHPPRMARWKKPFRRIGHWLRRRQSAQQERAAAEARAERVAASAVDELGIRRLPGQRDGREYREFWGDVRTWLWPCVLSIVPGMAHLVQGRFHAIWQYVAGWAWAMLMSAFFYATGMGVAAVSVAMVLHAWIMQDASMRKDMEEMDRVRRAGFRVTSLLVIGFAVFLLYWFVWGFIPFRAAPCAMAVPVHHVERGDFVLCRAAFPAANMKRGDLVLAKVQILRRGAEGPLGGVRYTGTRTGTVVGQVVGLPGETVQIVEGPQFVVNGRPLDVKAFQVPAWLTAQRIAVTLQDGEFFVVMEYQVRQGGNLRLQEGDVRRVSVLPEPSLVGRGLMRWTPVMRRAFLKNVEP